MASQKYLAFAAKADREGFATVAKLFRLAASAERIHAEGHLKALDAIGSTAANLQVAIDNETYEFTTMYPPMLDKARTDKHKAERMFKYAAAAEEVHAEVYKVALAAVREGKDLTAEFYLCPFCGYIEMGKPDAPCPICGSSVENFILAE
jgi:rubrerythrin